MGSDGAGAAAPARAVQTCDGRQAQAVCRRRPPARSAAPLRQGLEAAQGSRGRTWGPSPTRQPWPHAPHHPRLRLLREHSRQHLACIRHRHTQGDRRNVVSRPEKGKLLVANATGSLPLTRCPPRARRRVGTVDRAQLARSLTGHGTAKSQAAGARRRTPCFLLVQDNRQVQGRPRTCHHPRPCQRERGSPAASCRGW